MSATADKYYARRSFKAKVPETEQYKQYLPGELVPGAADWPNLQRWIDRDYITGDKNAVGRGGKNYSPNLPVDLDGNVIAHEDLAKFKAARDVKKIADKPMRVIMKEAQRLQLVTGGDERPQNRKELLELFYKNYLNFYEEHDAAMLRRKNRGKKFPGAETIDTGNDDLGNDPDDTTGDDRYDESELKKLKADDLREVATVEFDLEESELGNKAEVVEAILAADWTPQALAKLSREKLVEIAGELGLELDETSSAGELIPAILKEQAE